MCDRTLKKGAEIKKRIYVREISKEESMLFIMQFNMEGSEKHSSKAHGF